MSPYAAMLSALVQSASAVAGVTVRYSRGEAAATISGVLLGRASDLADTEDPNAPWIEHSDRDFFFRPQAIVLGGEQTLPQAFDLIVIQGDHPSAGKTYEVLYSGKSRSFSSCDPYETLLRVFTRQI